MAMVRIRKAEAGDASGHDDGTGRPWTFEWPEDGAVVAVPYAVAVELLRNPEWGFSEAGDDAPSDQTAAVEEPAPGATVEEPAPTAAISEAPTPRKAAKKTASAKE